MAIWLDAEGEPLNLPVPDHIEVETSLVPPPFDNVSVEERKEWIRKRVNEAENTYRESLAILNQLIRSVSPVELLSSFAYYDLFWHERTSRASVYKPIQQHHAEVLQALVLMVPARELGHDLYSFEQRMEVHQRLEQLCQAQSLRLIDPEKLSAEGYIRYMARTHTLSVRNPGDQKQVLDFLRGLFTPLDADMFRLREITFSGLIEVAAAFMTSATERSNSLMHAMRSVFARTSPGEMITEYGQQFGISESRIAWLLHECERRKPTLEETRAVLANDSEHVHPAIFILSLEDLQAAYPGKITTELLRAVLARWSTEFGANVGQNQDHLFLGNPVWVKPIIRIDTDRYFWPLLGSFVSFGLEMLEAQFIDEPTLKKKYERRRADFLESEVGNMLGKAFPTGNTYRSLKWCDPKQGETDVFTIVDHHALIVECKSGRIDPTARRGGDRLFRTVRDLIQEPTDQGNRFADLLKASEEVLEVRDEDNQVILIDRSRIERITRLNVTLDVFGPLACDVASLRRAGVVTSPSPTATMPLVDLENVFYLLDSPVQRLHYLHQRSFVEDRYRFVADEMDLLAYYLSGNFTRWPDNENITFAIYGNSKHLDPSLLRRALGMPRAVPSLSLSPWWTAVLARVEDRKFDGWSEVGQVMLSIPLEMQEEIESWIKQSISAIQSDPKALEGKDLIYCRNETPAASVGIGVLVLSAMARDAAHQNAGNAITLVQEHTGADVTLLVVISPWSISEPYVMLLRTRGSH